MGNKIPKRSEVPAKDKWDLSSIFTSDSEWENALNEIPQLTAKVAAFKGKLGESASSLLECLKTLETAELKLETVYHYASLQHEADEDDSVATDRDGRAMMAYTQMQAELSFIDPEIQSIDEAKLIKWINQPEFANYKKYIEKLLHFKPYILSEKEERVFYHFRDNLLKLQKQHSVYSQMQT